MRNPHLVVVFAVVKVDYSGELGVGVRQEPTAAVRVNDDALEQTLATLEVLVGSDAYLIHDSKQRQYVHEEQDPQDCPDLGSFDQLDLEERPLVLAGVVPLQVDGPRSAYQERALDDPRDYLLAGVESRVALPKRADRALLASSIFRHSNLIIVIVKCLQLLLIQN